MLFDENYCQLVKYKEGLRPTQEGIDCPPKIINQIFINKNH